MAGPRSGVTTRHGVLGRRVGFPTPGVRERADARPPKHREDRDVDDSPGRAVRFRPAPPGGRTILPTTRLGRWAAGLALAGVLLIPLWAVQPLGAFPGFGCSLIGGGLGLRAIFRHEGRDRAVSVMAAVVPLAYVVLFVIGSTLGALIVGDG